MNAISALIGIVGLIAALIAFIPLLGWLNWLVIPVVAIGLVLGRSPTKPPVETSTWPFWRLRCSGSLSAAGSFKVKRYRTRTGRPAQAWHPKP